MVKQELFGPPTWDCPECDESLVACQYHIQKMQEIRARRRELGLPDIGEDAAGKRRCFVCGALVPNWLSANHDCLWIYRDDAEVPQ